MNSTRSILSQGYLVGALALVALGCEPVVFGNGKIETAQTELPSFVRVAVGGDVNLTVSVGEGTALTLTGEENIVPQYEVVVRDDTLMIEPKQLISLHQTKQIVASISIPRLEGIEVSGASEVTADSLVSDTAVNLETSGSAKIKAGEIVAPRVEIGASGASEVEARGTTKSLEIDASGASKVVASALASEVLVVSASGSAKVGARASQEARGSASGSSEVVVEGAPERRQISTSGSASVTFP